jgi:hypothetical protein
MYVIWIYFSSTLSSILIQIVEGDFTKENKVYILLFNSEVEFDTNPN